MLSTTAWSRRVHIDRKSPRQGGVPWVRMVAEFLVAVLLQALIMGFHAWTYDEGLSLYGALRVLHGQIPYRDFWTMYPPGEFYLLAGIFHVFGVTVLCDRVLFILILAVTTVAIIYILDRLTARFWLSRAAALAILLWLSMRPAYGFPVYPAMALILVATACIVKRWQGGGSRQAWTAGLLVGLAALFRHDLALYALVALAGASVVYQLRVPRGERTGFAGADAVRLLLGSAVVVLPVLVLLLIYVPAHDLYYSLLYTPGVVYPKVRSLPFPTLRQVLHGFLHPITPDEPGPGNLEYNIVWLPVLAVLSALPLMVSEFRRTRMERMKATGVLALTLLTGLLFLKGIVRVSPVHMIPGVVPAFMLLACLVALLPEGSGLFRVCVLVSAAWAVFCLLAPVRTAYYAFRHNLRMYRGSDPALARACHPEAGLERLRCVFIPDEDRQAIAFVQSESRPDEAIFVGVPRYDILHESQIQVYFLAAREAGTKWYDLHPGVETTAPIQEEMVRELDRNHVRIVVQDDESFPVEPNMSRFSSGVNLLGDYIGRNYTVQRRFGDLEVLERVTPF